MTNRIVSILFLFALLVSSCQSDVSNKEQGLYHIPSSAELVVSFDVDQLMEKADYDEVTTMAFFQEVQKEIDSENEALSKVLKNPTESGMDLGKNFYISLEDQKENEEIIFVLPLEDHKKFEQFLENTEIEFDAYSQGVGQARDKKSSMTWNEEFAVVLINSNEDAKDKNLLELGKQESIATNKNLQKCLKEQADMSIWFNSKLLLEEEKAVEEIGNLLNVGLEDLLGNYLHTHLNFEQGQIKASSSYFIKPAISNDLDLLFKDAPETDFGSKFPSNGLQAMFTAGLELRGINQLLIEKHIKGTAKDKVEEYGISFEDLIDAVGGDVAVGLYELPSDSLSTDEEILFACNIIEQEKLNGLINKAVELEFIEKESDNLYRLKKTYKEEVNDTITYHHEAGVEAWALFKDGLLYMTNNDQLLEQIQSGKFEASGKVNNNLKAISNENIFSLYSIAQLGNKGPQPFAFITNELQVQSNRERTEFVIKTNDSEQNSLKTFFQELNKKHLEENEKKEQKI